MPNFAPNYTSRYKLSYSSGSWSGSSTFRFPASFGGTPPTGFVNAIGGLFLLLGERMFDNFAYTGAVVIPANENQGIPAPVPTNAVNVRAASPFGPEAETPEDPCFQVNYAGKSGTTNVRLSFGGFAAGAWIVNSGPEPWRTAAADDLLLAQTLAAIVSIPNLVGSNNQTVTMSSYVNYLYNYAYVRKLRG